jgi:hypothetical protein
VKTQRLKSFLSHPVLAVFALVIAPVGLYEWAQRAHQQHTASLESSLRPDPPAAGVNGVPYRTKYVHVPGVQPQVFHSGRERGEFANEEVIGVVVNGQPRAYLLEAMRPLNECVVNDVVAGQPISIIHAEEMGVIRVLVPREFRKIRTSTTEAEPVDLKIVGTIEGYLYLSGDGKEFFYDDMQIPLVDYPFSRCTWRVWRRAYPNSDLYSGSIEPFAE